MFSDPQFWVAIAFFLFVLAVFNPVRKIYENYGFYLAKDSNGKILQRKITQKRVNNEVSSHSSLFYLATSSTISKSIKKENNLNSKYIFKY